MATLTEQLRILITGQAGPAIAAFQETGSASEALAAKTTMSGKAMAALGMEGKTTGEALKAAAPAAAAIVGIGIAKWALDGAEKWADLGKEIRGFQRVSGASAEDSSKLNFAVKELGIAPDTAASAFGRLATRLGTGKAHLEEYGVSTKNADGSARKLVDVVGDLSAVYQKSGSAQEKAAIGNEAFGRSWQALSPLLGKGKADLEAIYEEAAKDHAIFSQDDLETTRKYSLAITQLKDSVTGLQMEAGKDFVPALTDAANVMKFGVQTTDKLKDSTGGLFSTFEKTINPVKGATEAIHGLTSLFDSGSQKSTTFADAQKKVQDATVALTQAQSEHGAKSHEAQAAEQALTTAARDLSAQQKELSTSLDKTNTALQSQAEKTQSLYQSELTASSAKLQLAQANTTLDKAAEEYTKTLGGYYMNEDKGTQAAFRRRDATHALEGAIISAIAASGKAAEAALPNASAHDKTAAAVKAENQEVIGLKQQYPGLTALISSLAKDIGKLPDATKGKKAKVEVDTDAANKSLDALERRIQRIVGQKYTVQIDTGGK